MIINPMIPIPIMIILAIICLVVIIKISRREQLIVRIAIVVMIFIINLRFMVPNGEADVYLSNLNVFFVVDTTISMNATDYNGSQTRLSGVQKDVKYILSKIPGGRYSVISFDNEGYLKLPLTSDANAVLASVNTLKPPKKYDAKGSSVTIFKEKLADSLKGSKAKGDYLNIVFIMTDGENTSDESMESLKKLSDNVDGGAVMGYGTSKGAKMQVEKDSGSTETVKSVETGKDAISKIDEKNLKEMAKDLDIDYVHMDKSSNIDKVLKNINSSKALTESEKKYAYKDIYYYFSPILVILFVIELILDRRTYS